MIKSKFIYNFFRRIFFILIAIAINFSTKSYSDTISVTSDTTINDPIYLESGIKEDRTYNITNNAVLTLNDEIEATSYTLTKTGNGTFVLNAASSSFESSISIDEGLVGIGNNDAFGTATVILNGGGISSSNTSSRSINNTINVTASSIIGNSTNNGTLTLSGDFSFDGVDKYTLTSNSNNTISGDVDLGSQNITFDTASGVTSTISGAVSNGNVVKSGSGTLKLTGTNTQSQTVLNGGILEVETDRGLGSEPGSLVSDNIRIADSTLKFSNTGTITLHANRGISLVNSNATIEVTNSGARVNYGGDISGNFNLTKTGSGILALAAANTHDLTGDVTISAGQMRFNSGTSDAYSFDVIVANGANASVNMDTFASGNSITVQSGGSLNFYPGTGSGRTYSMDISLAGSGNNNFNGGTAATLTSSNDRNTTLTGTVTLTADSNVLHKPNLNSDASNKFIFGNSNGSATTAINLGSNTFTLLAEGTNAREYQFLDLVTGTGTLDIDRYTTADFTSGEGGFADTVNLDVQGTLNMGSSDTIASLTGTSTGSIDLQNTTLTIDQDTNTTYAGVITDSTGTSSIVKSGTGTLTLSGTNSYSGNTTLNAGNLSVSADNNLGSAPGSTDADNIIFNGGGLIITSGVTFDSNRGVTMTGAGTINTASSTTSNIQGVITGSGALTKSGDGTLTLSATNTNTGDITISAGTLDVQGQLESGNYDGAISNSGQLKINSSSNQTLAGTISGTGELAKSGSGTLTLTGTNTYSGRSIIEGGTVVVSSSANLGATPGTADNDNIILNNGTIQSTSSFALGTNKGILVTGSGGTINTDASTTLTYGGVINGSGTLTKIGSGTLTLSGANTYTGSTTITNGTLSVSSSANLGATPGSADADNIIFNGGTLSATNDFTLGTNKGVTLTGNGTIEVTSSNTMTFDGIITDSGNLTKSGSGTLVLGGANQNDGTITVNAGILEISDQYSLGSSSGGTVVADGASLKITDAITIANESLTLNGNGVSNGGALQTTNSSGLITLTGTTTIGSDTTININDGNLTFDGRLTAGSNDYDLTITGGDGTIRPSGGLVLNSGTLTMSASGTFFAENSSTYSGGTTVTAGAIQYGANDAFGTGDITMTGGKFYTSDVSDFTIDENLNLQGSITLGNSGDSNTITFSGTNTLTGNTTASIDSALSMAAIDDGSNTYNFIKSGSGTLTLSGNNGYDGTTTISAGKLTVTGTLDDNTAVSVSSGATYDVDASDTIASIEGAGNIEIASSQTLTAGDSNDKTLSGVISGSGGLTKTGSGTQTLSGTNTYSGATTINAGTLTVSGTLSDSTAVTVASGATYDVDASDTVASIEGAGNIEIASSQVLTAGDTNNKTVSGVISGSGGLSKAGSGTLTLSGTNTYSGNTTISAGTIDVSGQLNNGSYAGNIANSGTLTFSSSNNQTLSGTLSGSGDLNKSGSGDLTLTGTNTFTGDTTLTAGTLFVGTASDGSNTIIPRDISVEGGTLSGGGVIGRNVTFSSTAGTLAPGNSIGTLTITGNLTLSADDTTKIEFNDSSSDKIVVNGNTVLAGTISLYPEDTTYSDVTHTIVDASGGGTFSGTFSTETMNNESNLNDATWDIVYDTTAKTVSLQITEAADPCNINCKTTVSSSKDIAKVFDNAISGTLKEVKDILDSSTVSSVNSELDKLKGTVLATSLVQPSTNHTYFNRAVSNTTTLSNTTFVSNFISTANDLSFASLQDQGLYGDKSKYNEYYDYSDTSVIGFIKNNKNKSFFERFQTDDRASFVRTYGTKTKRDNIGEGYTGYQSDTSGILLGEQFKESETSFNGYSIGITKTDTDYNDDYGDAEIYSVHASLFKQIDEEDFAFNLLGSAFISKTDSNRNVKVFGTSVDDRYKSDFYDVGLNVESQHIAKYDYNGLKISPSAKINYSYIFKGDTKETGGDLALSIDNEDLFIVKPEIGISLAKNFSEKDNKLSQIEFAAFASRDYFLEGTENKARFASGSTFNQDLPRDKEDYYSIGLGYNFLDKETNTSLMANAFLIENSKEDISSNIFSFTFRKLFGDFGRGRIPPVIVEKIEKTKEKVAKVILPEINNDGEGKNKEELIN